MMKKFLLLIGIITLITTQAFSQIKSFGKDPAVYIKELGQLMTENNIESAKLAYEEFKIIWEAKTFDEAQTAKIIKISNEMLRKRMRPSPEFEDYIKTLIAFSKSGKMATHSNSWFKMLENRLAESSKQFIQFLDISKGLFTDNTVTSSPARNWKFSNSDYTFDIEGEKVFLNFSKAVDIRCMSKGDSFFVYQTTGKMDISDYSWVGKKGKVLWTRGAWDEKKVNAQLNNYNIDLKTGGYKADSVLFVHGDFFSDPQMGYIEEKVMMAETDTGEIRYPKFYSYKNDFQINKFAEGVTFKGGFSLQGSKVIAAGTDQNPGVFTFYYKKKPRVEVKITELIVSNERLITDKAFITIFLDSTGNIIHPRVAFNYVKSEKRLIMARGEQGITSAPFLDNYHNLEITADYATWVIDQPMVDFRMLLKDAPAVFESVNYFRDFRYERVQGILGYHPLQRIKTYCEKNRIKEFNLKEYADAHGSREQDLIRQFIELNDDGYIIFNTKTKHVIVNDKLFNYVNAHMGRTDFDVIRFESIIAALPNASINFENYQMKVEGVPAFRFSDSQKVYAEPNEQRFFVKKNREIGFEGRVVAGRFEFFGKGMNFDYINFKIDMNAIDSLRLYFPDENNNLRRVGSVLSDINGTLFIDQQYNKSGRKDYTEYPIFKSNKGAKVYYDYPTTFGGVYKRDRFYFSVDPFTIDSLDNFTKSGLTFDGTFTSAGIFPEFRETLTLQDDYSLGFLRTDRLPMYGGKGNSDFLISLSNKGLFGTGKIDFANSVTESDKFMLFPDSTAAQSKSFVLGKNALYPQVTGNNVRTLWLPYKDQMSQFSQEEPFKLYDNATFKGELKLSSKGLNSNGSLEFEDAEIISANMKMNSRNIKADTSTLRIKSIDSTKFAFTASNVKSFVDFDKKLGDFKANSDDASSEFPYNMYKGSLNEFKWDIARKNLKFITPPGKPVEKSYFLSTHPQQDSLKFSSAEAYYDLNTFVLTAKKVPYINVADSRVVPDSGLVIIRENAAMDELKKSKLIVDTLNKWHNLYNCNLTVMGRLNMGGDGFYDYVDINKKKNKIFFNEIKVEYLTKLVIAKGYISDTADFTFGPKIQFKGYVTLEGKYKELYFNGHFLGIHDMYRPMTWWTRHDQYIKPDSVFLRVKEPINEDKKDLFTGFAISTDSVHVYPVFFSRKRNYSDGELINVKNGTFYYDNTKKEFVYIDSSRSAGSWKGNYYTFNEDKGKIFAEGDVNLGVNFKTLGFKTAGNITHSYADTSFKFSLLTLIDFKLPKEAQDLMFKLINEALTGGYATNLNNDFGKTALSNILETKDFDKVVKGLDKNEVDIIDELNKTFFFSKLDLRWNQARKSYTSSTSTAYLESIGKERIGKTIKTKMEIKRKRSGDEWICYIEASADVWFYINYIRGNLYIFSSNEDFNTLIKTQFEKVNGDGYFLKLASPMSKQKFLRSFDADEELPEEE